MNTPTSSISSASAQSAREVELERQIELMQQENKRNIKELKGKVRERDAQVTTMTEAIVGRSSKRSKKNGGVALPHLVHYVRHALWPKNKMMNPGWEIYDKDKKSMCGRFMSKVKMQPGDVAPVFWALQMVPVVEQSFAYRKNQSTKELRAVSFGEICVIN